MSDTIYYTYKILFSTGEYYIGRRKCPSEFTPETDPYLGSPVTNSHFWEVETPKKIILNVFDNCDDHVVDEAIQLGNKWKSDNKCLNASPANNKSNANFIWCNDGEVSYMLPQELIPENFKIGRLGTKAKGKKYYNNGKISRMFFENEAPAGWVKGNLSSQGNNNPSVIYGSPTKGFKAYNNGINTIYLKETEKIPEGYVLGRTEDFKQKRKKAVSGKNNPRYGSRGEKWYNNGVINKLCIPGEEPDGFAKGMVKNAKR